MTPPSNPSAPSILAPAPVALLAALLSGLGLAGAACGGGGEGGDEAPAVRRCRPPAGFSGSPSTIAEVVATINAMPHPVTLTCFLETLDRPLRLSATRSVISLQPASGSRSPRMFLLSPGLITSVVPAGKGATLLEFGELVAEDQRPFDVRSVKGEIEFPVERPLTAADPYTRIRSTGERPGTTCRACHRDEEAVTDPAYPDAFISGALRPDPRLDVALFSVQTEHAECDAAAEPTRCAIFRALFDHGEVIETAFPEEIPIL